jgi:hypothetical protein
MYFCLDQNFDASKHLSSSKATLKGLVLYSCLLFCPQAGLLQQLKSLLHI